MQPVFVGADQPFYGYNNIGIVSMLPGLCAPDDAYYDHGLHAPG